MTTLRHHGGSIRARQDLTTAQQQDLEHTGGGHRRQFAGLAITEYIFTRKSGGPICIVASVFKKKKHGYMFDEYAHEQELKRRGVQGWW